MRPKYQIKLDGSDITSNFNDRLLSLNVTDRLGGEGDTLTIELDDRDESLDVPPTGKQLEVFLGYEETGLQSMGSYTVDKIALNYRPGTMTIHAVSADLSSDKLKAHRNNNYENQSLADIAQTIAARQGLRTYVDPAISSSKFAMVHQTDESDMHLMQRLARDGGANFKIAGGTLILSKAGSSLSSSGADMSVTVTPIQVKPGSVVVDHKDRSKFDSANAYSFNKDTWQRETSTAPIGSAAQTGGGFAVRHPMMDKERAQSAANARADELQRAEVSASCTLALGDPGVSVSASLTLSGFRPGIDGSYDITSVEHNYDSAGYTTAIEAENAVSGGAN